MPSPAKINRKSSRSLAAIGVRLLDDAHMTWLAAEIESEHALRAWCAAPAPQDTAAYLTYRAAADREEAAAADPQRLCEPTGPCQEQFALSR